MIFPLRFRFAVRAAAAPAASAADCLWRVNPLAWMPLGGLKCLASADAKPPCASPVVIGNWCHGNRRAGIGIRTGADTRPLVQGNRCYENEMAGIGVRDEASSRPGARQMLGEHLRLRRGDP